MKPMDIKNKILWSISMIALLGISYWLCRFFYFEMHGMKQWPNLLAILSIAIIIMATIFGNRITPVASVVGYMGGFIIAMIFNTNGVDPGGGSRNNAWIIWGTVFVLSILISIIWGFISKKRRNVIVGVMLIIWFAFLVTDFSLAKANKSPIFAIPVIRYKDGGSTEYYGLGYKVIKYVNLIVERGPEVEKIDFGTWFMRFSPPQ